MRRLAVIDWLLIGISLPIFLFGLVMTLVHGVRGDFVAPPFWVTTAANQRAYPVVDQVWSPAGTEPNPLAVGDRVVRLEDIDLLGVSNAGFFVHWSSAAQAGARSLRLAIERGPVHSEVRVPLVPGFYIEAGPPWWTALPFMIGLMCTALLLLVRAPHWHLARRNYVASVLLVVWCTPYFTVATASRAEIIGDIVIIPLAQALFLWNLDEFLPGIGLWSAGQRAVAWGLALLQSAATAAMYWWPDAGTAPISLIGVAGLGFTLAYLAALTRVYGRADPLGRRQIKWVVYGFYVGLLPWGVAEARLSLGVLPGWLAMLPSIAQLGLVAIPVGFLIAIAFYQLLDIDRLFSATLSYTILAILGLAMVLGLMPAVSRMASDAVGVDPVTGQAVVALGMAAVLVSAHRIVRPWIDRRFFPERVTLEHGFEKLFVEIARVVDMPELTRLVGVQLDSLLGPAAVVLYARAGDIFTPLVVRGRSASPTFAVRSALRRVASGAHHAARREPLDGATDGDPHAVRAGGDRDARRRSAGAYPAKRRAGWVLVPRTETLRRHLHGDGPRPAGGGRRGDVGLARGTRRRTIDGRVVRSSGRGR
jgi:hypothetical protein